MNNTYSLLVIMTNLLQLLWWAWNRLHCFCSDT